MTHRQTNGESRSPVAAVPPSWMPAGFTRTTLPGRIVFADGAIGGLGEELDRLQARRVMVIAAGRDGHLADVAGQALGHREHKVWTEVRRHVPTEVASRAVAAAGEHNVDALLAIGGGSAIGLGKAVAVSSGLPLVCVPTTYSGSEMTPIYGLTTGSDKKTARDIKALPKVVVYDPALVTTLPASVVGPSAMNALAHCAEALWAPQTDPISDAVALEGARRLQRHLRAAYAGPDAGARGQVLIASCMAGLVVGTVGTSLHHGLCHLLGGLFDTPHADTHAIMLPYVIDYLRPAVPLAVERLSAAISAPPGELADTIWSLARAVGTPHGLREIGVTEAQVNQAAEAALAKGLTSPRTLDRAGLHRVLDNAWRGMVPSVH